MGKPAMTNAFVARVMRYFDGRMTPGEAARFELEAARDDEFARAARSVCRVLESYGPKEAFAAALAESAIGEASGQAWLDRLELVISDLHAQGSQLAKSLLNGAALAVEISLDRAKGTVSIASDIASACVMQGLTLQFSSPGSGWNERRRSSNDQSAEAPRESKEQMELVWTSDDGRFSGSLVADSAEEMVSITFYDDAPDEVLLLPAEENEPLTATVRNRVAIFRKVPDGRFLLTAPPPQSFAQ